MAASKAVADDTTQPEKPAPDDTTQPDKSVTGDTTQPEKPREEPPDGVKFACLGFFLLIIFLTFCETVENSRMKNGGTKKGNPSMQTQDPEHVWANVSRLSILDFMLPLIPEYVPL